ncbi:hypothetical protein [Legionella drancourtii]|uniref:Uncharacterized protein n=1 Tax=Legionella drancourtii LLAP12 TaxID=658187 RepID=G9ENV2_9GAMM|nr:hypothetical protein [Legionella drancourtii]EHL31024.1 hypothetical protein LDG_6930 [Legionella drancourtii LLAP12]
MTQKIEQFDEIVKVIEEIETSRIENELELKKFTEAREDFYVAPEIKNNYIPFLEEAIKASLDREAYLKLIISKQPITSEEAEHLLKCEYIKGKFEELINNSIERNTYSP